MKDNAKPVLEDGYHLGVDAMVVQRVAELAEPDEIRKKMLEIPSSLFDEAERMSQVKLGPRSMNRYIVMALENQLKRDNGELIISEAEVQLVRESAQQAAEEVETRISPLMNAVAAFLKRQ